MSAALNLQQFVVYNRVNDNIDIFYTFSTNLALQFAGTNLNSIAKNHNLLMAPYFVLQLVPSKLIEHAMPVIHS